MNRFAAVSPWPSRVIARRKLANRILRSNILRMDDEGLRRYATNTRRLLESPDLDTGFPPEQSGLVFTGEFDVFTTPRHCKQIADAMPRSHYILVLDADRLFYIKQFEKTLQVLNDFAKMRSGESVFTNPNRVSLIDHALITLTPAQGI